MQILYSEFRVFNIKMMEKQYLVLCCQHVFKKRGYPLLFSNTRLTFTHLHNTTTNNNNII